MESQNEEKTKICTLCFEICNENFEAIDSVTRQMLRIVLLTPDLSVVERPGICNCCKDNLEKCYDFKSSCLDTEDSINAFASDKDGSKLDITDIYLNKYKSSESNLVQSHTICRLCLKVIEYESCIKLNDESKDITSLAILLNQYFPELDLNITQNPAFCNSCYASLQDYFIFMNKCSAPENKEKTVSYDEGSSNKDQVEVKWVPQFSPNIVLKHENDAYSDIPKSSSVKEGCVEGLRQAGVEDTGSEKIGVKNEVNSIGIDHTNLKKNHKKPTKLHKCEICNYTTKRGFDLKKHMVIHRDPTDVTMYHCALCNFKTKYKCNLKTHLPVHEAVQYHCEDCEYKTKSKSNLARHLLSHENAKNEKYYCEICKYEVKHKYTLKRHMIAHHKDTDVTVYRCEACDYNTKLKYNLKKHMRTHQTDSETTAYQCEICGLKTKRKDNLKSHMLVHQEPLYNCECCEFKTRHKSTFKQHLLVHKNKDLYQCNICRCKLKYKYSLKRHMIANHKASDETVFQCTDCDFKTNIRYDFKKHVAAHQESMYRCEICDYKTEHRIRIKQHELVHRDVSEVTMYGCELCNFKSKHKRSLMTHVMMHRDASQLTMYRCTACNFKTKYKNSFKHHTKTRH